MDAAYVFPTDTDWAAFLAQRPGLQEANFWLPSPVPFRALAVGDPLLFKAKAAAGGRIIGGGVYCGYTQLHVSEAWRIYGEANGCASAAELLAAQLLAPTGFPSAAVRGLRYTPERPGWSQVERLVEDLIWRSGIPHAQPESALASYVSGPVFGDPRLVRQRLGQQGFRALVLTSYQRRCAITGARVTPTLQAAHIRPVSEGGVNVVSNGLLLRSDVHTLFDAGYLGIDTAHRLRVSPRLRAEFGNGEEFYSRAGTVIALPGVRADRPDADAVTWHMDVCFKAS